MFNKVLLTFTTRILTALLSVVNVLIGTNYLGVEGYGTISLIILGVTVYLMIQNLITGSSIVYFISRFNVGSIIILSYAWVLISALAFSLITYGSLELSRYFGWDFEIVPADYALHNIFIAMGYGLMNIHLNVLLGRERIKAFNFIFFIQHALASAMLVLFYIVLQKKDLEYYLIALYASYFTSFIISFTLTMSYIKDLRKPMISEFKSMLKYGALGQSANVFQLINYRLSYYLIDIFVGRASLGVFSAATQISEGLWILGKSIATVQFARISNSDDRNYAHRLSMKLLKFTSTLTLLPLIILTVMPKEFYTFLLGEEFIQVRSLIRWMAVGTLSLTASMILSHYFSGTGRIAKNTMASGMGVIITVILGFTLIPTFGIKGAAVITSSSYFVALLYLFILFQREHDGTLRDYLIRWKDVRESYALVFKRKQMENQA